MIYLDKAIKLVLQADTAIGALVPDTAIYPNKIAEDAGAPCIYFQGIKKPYIQTKNGISRSNMWTYIFGYKGTTSAEVQAIRDAVCKCLLSKRRQVKTEDTDLCLIENVLHLDYQNFGYIDDLKTWDEQDVLLVQWRGVTQDG